MARMLSTVLAQLIADLPVPEAVPESVYRARVVGPDATQEVVFRKGRMPDGKPVWTIDVEGQQS